MNTENIISLARDLTFGRVEGEHTKAESSEVLRQALIEANGGTAKLNPKAIRRNGVMIQELIEEIIPSLIEEGLRGDEFFMNLVDERSIKAGDAITFYAEAGSTFVVSQIADGIARPRRQRIGENTEVSVTPTWHAVRIYEEWSRFIAGRIDWDELIEKVAKSFKQTLYLDIFAALSGITSDTPGFDSDHILSGTYSEEDLLNLVELVEAETGKRAVIVGTKSALRKCTTAVLATEAKSSYYNEGYYGKLAGVDMIAVKNVKLPGTNALAFANDVVYVIASEDKPFKVVREGEAWVDDITSGNADKTIEYNYQEKYGVGIVSAGKIGRYTIA
jgi:hypothetical protein